MEFLIITLLSLFFAAGDEILNGDNSVAVPTIVKQKEIRDEPQKVNKMWYARPE